MYLFLESSEITCLVLSVSRRVSEISNDGGNYRLGIVRGDGPLFRIVNSYLKIFFEI